MDIPTKSPDAGTLREARRTSTLRALDLAQSLNVPEAALLEAELGHGVTRIAAGPGKLIPIVQALGEVMGLTRNRSCVIEKVGTYNDFHDGQHASMTLDPEMDMRFFPSQWVHGYAVELDGKKSVQVFDAAGGAIHKVHLRDSSDLAGFDALKSALALPDQSPGTVFEAPAPTSGAIVLPDRAEKLREQWARMTDTHQFNALVRRLKINRLGAYRIAGAPFVWPLAVEAVPALIERVAGTGTQVMMFVGNSGCIEIHSGGFGNIKPVGPWLNVMDPRFNLHLRGDHVAEVWAVDKPTKRGPAISVEAFDAEGGLIFQCFCQREDRGGDHAAWAELVAALPAGGDA